MTFDRRRFLKSVSAGAISSAVFSKCAFATTPTTTVQEVLQTAQSPVFKLGLAAYSFKPHFEFYKGKKAKAEPLDGKKIDMFGFRQ